MFYHFTSREHLSDIEASGVIFPSESNVGSPVPRLKPYGKHVGPDVVWLLDTPDPTSFDHGLTRSIQNKRAVRITVNVPAIRWLDWLPAHSMNREWRQGLIKAGGGEEAASHWYVWPAPIRRSRWITIKGTGSR